MNNELDKSSWREYAFSDIASNVSAHVNPQDTDAEIYVGLEHIDPNDIVIRRYGSPADVKGTKLKVSKGDIIFGKRRAYQRKAAVADFDGICSAHAMVLRAKPEVILPKLLPFFMHSDTFMKRAVKISEGSLSPTIKWSTLSKQKFKLPGLNQQKELLRALTNSQKHIDDYDKLIIDLNTLFQSSLNSLIVRPENEQSVVGKDITTIKGVSYKASEISDTPPGIQIINLKCFEKFGGFSKRGMKYFTGEKVSESHILNPNDLVIAATDITRTGDVVGYPIFVPNFGQDTIFTMDVMKLQIHNNDRIHPMYLYYLLRTRWGHWHMFAHASGTTVLHLDSVALSKLPYPEVGLHDQAEVAARLSSLEESISSTRESMLAAKEVLNHLVGRIF